MIEQLGQPATRPPASPAADDRVLSTLNADGSRHWIKPRLATGRFWHLRRIVAYGLIAIFTIIPYVNLGGKPIVLLDIVKREFTFFGKTFLPTDSLLMALLVVSVFVTIFLLTSLFGRVWCGWACPQTVYMEFLFRPIERLLEGAPGRRSPSAEQLPLRKAIKFATYLVLSMFLAHTFLAYFVGIEQLLHWVRSSPFTHPVAFCVMAATTVAMLFDFGYFREQMCIVTCPYGRFQSVMLDRRSLIVSYDRARGEPRGRGARRSWSSTPSETTLSLRVLGDAGETDAAAVTHAGGKKDGCGGGCNHASEDGPCARQPERACVAATPPAAQVNQRNVGDCVDCGLCVAVCPTGIDIRKGLQMECINCTQCIDACNDVMTTLKRPLNLIRYSSQAMDEAAAGAPKPARLRPRVIIYSVILAALLSAFVFLLSTSKSADLALLRGRGTPFYSAPHGLITNQLTLKVANRDSRPTTFVVEIDSPVSARIAGDTNSISVPPGRQESLGFTVSLPQTAFHNGHCDAVFRVKDDQGRVQTLSFRLLGPEHGHDDTDHDESDKKHKEDGDK